MLRYCLIALTLIVTTPARAAVDIQPVTSPVGLRHGLSKSTRSPSSHWN